MSIETRTPFDGLAAVESSASPTEAERLVIQILEAIISDVPIDTRDFIAAVTLEPSLGYSILNLLDGCNDEVPNSVRKFLEQFAYDSEAELDLFFALDCVRSGDTHYM